MLLTVSSRQPLMCCTLSCICATSISSLPLLSCRLVSMLTSKFSTSSFSLFFSSWECLLTCCNFQLMVVSSSLFMYFGIQNNKSVIQNLLTIICLKSVACTYIVWQECMIIMMISNKLQQLRYSYRSQLRKDQIKKYQAQVRKLMISAWQNSTKECPFCANSDLGMQISQTIAKQLQNIFNKQQVCSSHIELLFSKLLQTIEQQPQHLAYLIFKDSQQQAQFYIRKVVLLLQIISNEILISKEQIQFKIYNIFKDINGFGQILFDSAFGLNNNSFYQSEQATINRNADVKRISFNTLLLIFYKYPLLLVDYFQEYPMVWLLRECNETKLLQIYEVILEIFHLTRIDPTYQRMYTYTELCLKQHVQQSKTLKHSYEVEQKLFWLINNFLTIIPLPNSELMFEILSLCRNKKPRLIKKINSRLTVLLQEKEQLDEYHQELLTNTLSMVDQFYDSSTENQMEIE